MPWGTHAAHPATPLWIEHCLRRAGGSQDLVLQINKTGDGKGAGGHEEQITNPKSISAASKGLQPRSAQLQNALLQGTALLGACAQHSASSTLEELLPFIYSFLSPILSGHIFNPDPLNGLQTNSNIEESMLVVFKNVSPLKNAAEGEKLLCW